MEFLVAVVALYFVYKILKRWFKGRIYEVYGGHKYLNTLDKKGICRCRHCKKHKVKIARSPQDNYNPNWQCPKCGEYEMHWIGDTSLAGCRNCSYIA